MRTQDQEIRMCRSVGAQEKPKPTEDDERGLQAGMLIRTRAGVQLFAAVSGSEWLASM